MGPTFPLWIAAGAAASQLVRLTHTGPGTPGTGARDSIHDPGSRRRIHRGAWGASRELHERQPVREGGRLVTSTPRAASTETLGGDGGNTKQLTLLDGPGSKINDQPLGCCG